MREFDTEMIKLITTFENMTSAGVRDCVKNDCLYFLVEEGKASLAIGKGGERIKHAEKMFGKKIKVFEWNQDEGKFLNNLVPQAKKIEVKNEIASISLASRDRGIVIGKEGSNIKILRELIQRNSNIKDLKIL